MTKRNGGKPFDKVIAELNPVLKGFANYFSIANCLNVFKALTA